MGTEDWRAIAVGYAAGFLMMFVAGISWQVPAAAVCAAAACRAFWRS